MNSLMLLSMNCKWPEHIDEAIIFKGNRLFAANKVLHPSQIELGN